MNVIADGSVFLTKPFEMFTVGATTVTLELGDGKVFGTYEAQTSYSGHMPPNVTLKVVGGSITRY